MGVAAELKREIDRPKLPYSPGRKEDLGWRRHLPIRKLTEEEWEDYQRVRKQRFKDRCVRIWKEKQQRMEGCCSRAYCD